MENKSFGGVAGTDEAPTLINKTNVVNSEDDDVENEMENMGDCIDKKIMIFIWMWRIPVVLMMRKNKVTVYQWVDLAIMVIDFVLALLSFSVLFLNGIIS